MQLPKIKEAIVVEGKYDKIKLSSMVDAVIVETSGFHIFKDPEQLAFIRRLAETTGVILFTDSDGAGFVIRNYLTGALNGATIKQAYIPDLYGKERRKNAPSKEGKLGVEGVPKQEILDALRRAGATFADSTQEAVERTPITKSDLFDWGITGGENSTERRRWLLRKLRLPERMTTNAMLRVLNETMERDALFSLLNSQEK